MNADFPYKPGDRVKRPEWDADVSCRITAVGESAFLGYMRRNGLENTVETDHSISPDIAWTLVPPPVPRYAVEIRSAQLGERFLTQDLTFFPGFNDDIRIRIHEREQPSGSKRLVIVADLTDNTGD